MLVFAERVTYASGFSLILPDMLFGTVSQEWVTYVENEVQGINNIPRHLMDHMIWWIYSYAFPWLGSTVINICDRACENRACGQLKFDNFSKFRLS